MGTTTGHGTLIKSLAGWQCQVQPVGLTTFLWKTCFFLYGTCFEVCVEVGRWFGCRWPLVLGLGAIGFGEMAIGFVGSQRDLHWQLETPTGSALVTNGHQRAPTGTNGICIGNQRAPTGWTWHCQVLALWLTRKGCPLESCKFQFLLSRF